MKAVSFESHYDILQRHWLSLNEKKNEKKKSKQLAFQKIPNKRDLAGLLLP